MEHDSKDHTHCASVELEPVPQLILQNGLRQLLRLTTGLEFRPIVSARYPLPLTQAVCGDIPEPPEVRDRPPPPRTMSTPLAPAWAARRSLRTMSASSPPSDRRSATAPSRRSRPGRTMGTTTCPTSTTVPCTPRSTPSAWLPIGEQSWPHYNSFLAWFNSG